MLFKESVIMEVISEVCLDVTSLHLYPCAGGMEFTISVSVCSGDLCGCS